MFYLDRIWYESPTDSVQSSEIKLLSIWMPEWIVVTSHRIEIILVIDFKRFEINRYHSEIEHQNHSKTQIYSENDLVFCRKVKPHHRHRFDRHGTEPSIQQPNCQHSFLCSNLVLVKSFCFKRKCSIIV